MSTSSEQRRFLKSCDKTCTISRSSVSPGTNYDQVLGDPEPVALTIPCRVDALKVSADMIAAGPFPVRTAVMMVPPSTDIKHKDEVLVDGEKWEVRDPPQPFNSRKSVHHIEVILVRKVVQ